VNNNQLRELPTSLAQLPKLVTGEGCERQDGTQKHGLQVFGNPLPYPDEVVYGDAAVIQAFLRDMQNYYIRRNLGMGAVVVGGVSGLVGWAWWTQRRRKGKKKRG
jgi:hypothetical protein